MKSSSSSFFYHILFFLFWPFGAFLLAITTNINKRNSHLIILFFYLLYGTTFVLDNEGFDSFRYYQWFVSWSDKGITDYWETILNIFEGASIESGQTDLFLPTINFFLSQLSTSSGVLFGFFALIFGVVSLKSLRLISIGSEQSNNLLYKYYLFFFISIIAIININGFRFWFASWVFFYGAYRFLTTEKREDKIRFSLVVISSSLVHFSYIIWICLFFIHRLLGRKIKIFFVLALVGLILPLGDYLVGFTEYFELSSLYEDKIEGYFAADAMTSFEEQEQGRVWFKRIPFLYYGEIGLALSLLLRYWNEGSKSLKAPTLNLLNYLSFLFLIMTHFSHIGQMIRFRAIFGLFLVASLIQVYNDLKIYKPRVIDLITVPALLIHLSLVFRSGAETMNFYALAPIFYPFSYFDSTPLSSILFN